MSSGLSECELVSEFVISFAQIETIHMYDYIC